MTESSLAPNLKHLQIENAQLRLREQDLLQTVDRLSAYPFQKAETHAPRGPYAQMGREIGALVESKQEQYGDSFGRSGTVMRTLYPKGVMPWQLNDALAIVRIVDKLFRIAQRGPDGQDKGGESPYRDIAGYGLLGAVRDEGEAGCETTLADDQKTPAPDIAWSSCSIRTAMEIAVARFGGNADGVFNLAVFENVLCEFLGNHEGISTQRLRGALAARSDVEPADPSPTCSHYRIKNWAPRTELAAS